jgi:G3E family GTPase
VTIVLDRPFAWPLIAGWLEWITALRGPDILRIKGLVAVEGEPGPVLVQGVQHVFFPPRVLPDWPDADRRSRIVVIARGVPEAALRASFDRFAQAHEAA